MPAPDERLTRRPYLLLGFQVVLIAILRFSDGGFDKAGRFGLDFGGVLVLLGALCIGWLLGVWHSARQRSWTALALHLALPLAAYPILKDI